MKPFRVLLIDDDLSLIEKLTHSLQIKDIVVEEQNDGQSGLLAALNKKCDLIVSGIYLPTMSGFSMLNQLRKSRQTPVMMLTANDQEEERIEAYKTGADDYLSKSLSLAEIELRIHTLLRRSSGSKSINKNELSTGELTLLKNEKEVIYKGKKVSLTPIQFRLLWVLVEHQNEVLNKPYLYQTVLERPFSQYDRSLDMHLSRIRKKLVEAKMPAEHFVTVHGIGYLFN